MHPHLSNPATWIHYKQQLSLSFSAVNTKTSITATFEKLMFGQQTQLPETFLAANWGHVREHVLPSASSAGQKTNCHKMPAH
jgi:hypothetical protein